MPETTSLGSGRGLVSTMSIGLSKQSQRAMRAMVLSATLALVSWPALAVDGTNLPGHDYANFDAPSALVCQDTCGGESECQAYTWVKPGFQGAGGHCRLKNAVPPIVKDRCCDSLSHEMITKRDLRVEYKINRPGSDFKNFVIDRWETCEAACEENDLCASWTYARPGARGSKAHCWLKNRVARPVADQSTISGVKYKEPSVRID